MLQNIKHFYGVKIGAADGVVGHVKDFYFDDKNWAVRYLVVDTGAWLPGRQVLLTPHAFGPDAFGQFDRSANILAATLTRKQIQEAPSLDERGPILRQYEKEYHAYYGWPNYWDKTALNLKNAKNNSVLAPPSPKENVPLDDEVELRSTKAIIGFEVRAADGQIGSIRSFMMEGDHWAIRELVVETGNWYASRTIPIPPENITRVSYKESKVFVNLTRQDIKEPRKSDVAPIIVSQR